SSLKRLRRKYSIPSSRKSIVNVSKTAAVQLVMNKMQDDLAGERGIGWVKHSLANDLTPIPRDFVRKVMLALDPLGTSRRFPGKIKDKPLRGRLTAIGPGAEINCDGHDKLGAQALTMGDIGLPIYGMKDKYSGYVLHLVVVPNNRLETAIGHVYLDMLEQHKKFPLQVTVDKGSETGIMGGCQIALRNAFTPDIDQQKYPPVVAIPSTRNTVIEGFWRWFRNATGKTLFILTVHLQQGKTAGYFDSGNPLHIPVFNFIWPSIVQNELDRYKEEWNNHKIRRQKDKMMPSGFTPRTVFIAAEQPEIAQGRNVKDCFQPVQAEDIAVLRGLIPVTRAEAFTWVEEPMLTVLTTIYAGLRDVPALNNLKPIDGWPVFNVLVSELDMYIANLQAQS
ncbi:hypothetical protein SISNIDRAFT_420719, partial [Sistotremastrum niveocremeum HHB9708]